MGLKRQNTEKGDKVTASPSASTGSGSMSSHKMSLFNRWKNQTAATDVAMDGISEDEMEEFKEAFRLFDRVSPFVTVPTPAKKRFS